MPVLNVDGDRLHYLDEGAGTTVIFIHGSCGGSGQWRALSSRLQESYRTICLDLFGSGTWRALPETVKETMRSGTARLYHEWLTVELEAPSRDDLAALDIPVLLLKGSRTIASMHRICEIVARALPNCRYETIEGAGHMGPFTHVERVSSLIAAHLATAS